MKPERLNDLEQKAVDHRKGQGPGLTDDEVFELVKEFRVLWENDLLHQIFYSEHPEASER